MSGSGCSAGLNPRLPHDYATAVFDLTDAVVRKPDGTILFCSPGFCSHYGWAREEAIGKSAHELLRTEFPAAIEEIEAELRRAGDWTGTLRQRKRDGGAVWVYSRWAFARDTDGNAANVIETYSDITAWKAAEEGRHAVLTAMLDATDVMLAYLDPEFRFVLVNPAYAATCGKRAEELAGVNHFALYPNEENEAIFRRVRDTGEPVFYKDKPFEFPDQPERGMTYWDWSLEPVKDGAKVVGLVLSLRDNTKYKLAEDAVRKTVLFPEQNPTPVMRVAEDGALLYANPSSNRLLAAWSSGKGGMVPDILIEAVRDALRLGAPIERSVRAAGREYSFVVAPVAGSGHANLYGRDVTEWNRILRELQESEERYRTLFTSMSEGFATGDAVWDENGRAVDFRLLEMNEAFERQSGLGREILGKPMREVLPNLEPVWVENYCRVAVTGEPVRFEAYNRDTDRHYSLFAYSPAKGHFAIVFSDVTDRKHAEARIRQAQKLESLGLLAGGVAHDFNNLLVGVIGNASLALELLPEGHDCAALLERVVKAGEQAAHLTRQMLAYSGKGQFLLEPVNLSKLLPEIKDLVLPSIPKKVSLSFELDEQVPAIEADRGQVQQIFMNLALNAAEAFGGNAGSIRVKTGAMDVDGEFPLRHPECRDLSPGKYAYLEVSDTGCGMDEATRAKIFDPFFTTKFMGRGLGLAAVSGIVRAHNGGIAVTSAPGEGSCFTVLFPVAGRTPRGAEGTRSVRVQSSGTVLVVDDEPIVQEMARNSLERQGYTVLVAASGPAAIDIFKRYPGEISLVVLDLSMPGMSGEEALPELRKIRPGVAVIISSGYGEAVAMRQFGGQRVAGFIQKPYTPRGLVEKIQGLLR